MIKNLAIRDASSKTLLLLAIVLGLVTAVLVGIYLKGLDSGGSSASGGPTLNIVVAAQDIPALTRITGDMVTVKALPSDSVLAGTFHTTNQVVGQVTQVDLAAGEQVIAPRIAPTGEAAQETLGANTPLSLVVPEGKRAFSIYSSRVAAVGGLVRPGDYIDVVLSGAKTGEGSQDFLTPGAACYLLQDVQVLAVDENLKGASASGEANAITAAPNAGDAHSTTVAVTADEAWWLAAAQQNVSGDGVGNQLWIVMRPFGEHGQNANLPLCGIVPGS